MKEQKQSGQIAHGSTRQDPDTDSSHGLDPRECILILRDIQHLLDSTPRDFEVLSQVTERSHIVETET
jgi:hypothetical protein